MVAITFGTIWQKNRGRGVNLTTNTAVQYAGALLPIAIGMAATEQGRFEVTSVPGWVGLIWSIFGLSIGAILLLMVLIRHGAVAQVASLFYLVPGVSALMALGMFGESLTGVQMAGLAVAAGRGDRKQGIAESDRPPATLADIRDDARQHQNPQLAGRLP